MKEARPTTVPAPVLTHAEILMDAISLHPCGIADLACALHNRAGVNERVMYAAARKTVQDLMDAGRVVRWEDKHGGLNSCYLLPAGTPIEPKKEKP